MSKQKPAGSPRQIKGTAWRKSEAGTSHLQGRIKAPLCGEQGQTRRQTAGTEKRGEATQRVGAGSEEPEKGNRPKPQAQGCCAAGEPGLGAAAPRKRLHGHGGESCRGAGAPAARSGGRGAEGRGRRQLLGQGKAARPPGLPGAARGARVRAVTAHSDLPPLPEERPRRRRPCPPRSAPPRCEMAAPPPRGALPRTAAWRPPARFPACLPGKSGGRRRLLFRVPARPHRRRCGEGCAQRRPPARVPWAAPRLLPHQAPGLGPAPPGGETPVAAAPCRFLG